MLLTGGRTPEPVDLRLQGGLVVEAGPRLHPQPGETVLDLSGRFVRHGLRDAHAHVAEWARSRRQVQLCAAPTARAAAELVAAAHRSLAAGAPLHGSGFRDALWPDAPHAQLLERSAPGRVVVLRSLDMHTAWLSPAALARCGLADHPTGLLREHEAWEALGRLPAPSDREDDDAVADAARAAHARGLTSVRDFSFEDAHGVWSRRARAAGGALPLRVTAVVQPAHLASYAARGLGTGDGDAFLRVGPLKLFVDGALGARTARCLTPYAGTHDHGRQLLSPEALRAAVDEARQARFTVAVHAIGDEATRDALQVLTTAGVPATLEHAQLLRPEDLPLFAAAGITASIQPAHLLEDADLVDDLWGASTSIPYAVRSLLDAGATVALGSDAPVSPLDPWRGLASAVHRSDGTRPPWHPEEAVTLAEALELSGARRPVAGDHADLVVLDVPDPAVLSPADLAQVAVHATFLGGRCVHGWWRERDPAAVG